jgi:predicted ferric reductase
MYRWHHGVGLASYLLLLAHPLALAASAWLESPRLAWQTLSPLSEGWPVWLGWASLLFLMVGTGASVSSRLPYRTWRLLHGLLGIGVLLGLLHLVLLGISETVAVAAVIAFVLLAWRVIRVDLGLAARPYVVASVQHIADASVEIVLRPLSTPLGTSAGQFVMVAFSDGLHFRGCREYHPFSVSAIDSGGTLCIGVKSLGDCTRVMQTLEPGVAARVHGSFGAFLSERPDAPELWVAGGIGITPFIGLLRASAPSRPTILLYLYRSTLDAAYASELHSLAQTSPMLSLRAEATGDGLPDLQALLPDANTLAGRHCYLCGPPGLVGTVSHVLRERGVTAERIHYESFDFR